jgi:hypothetical protein
MTDHLPSEYLIERGWQPPEEGRNHWLGPDGKPTYFWSAVNTSNYQILLDAIAFTEDRSQLNIGLELEGHPPLEIDLRALDHALAVWALLRSDPKALARYADEPSTKLSMGARAASGRAARPTRPRRRPARRPARGHPGIGG